MTVKGDVMAYWHPKEYSTAFCTTILVNKYGGAENAGVENAGVETTGEDSRGENCRSGRSRSR